jgi:hypothetical protein
MIRRIVPTSEAATEHIPIAEDLLKRGIRAWETSGLDVWQRQYSVDDTGTIIEVRCTADEARAVIISGGITGFLFHPRTGEIATDDNGLRYVHGTGGQPDGTPVAGGPYLYPLVDDDGGTRNISWDADTAAWEYDENPPENYGNIWWFGPDGEVLSWRGPAGRLLPVDADKNYTGLSQFDEDLLTGGTKYTPFGGSIYEGGTAIAAPAGYKVLGAAYYNGELVAVLGGNYRDLTNPLGGTGGFFAELHVLTGGEWSRMAFIATGRPLSPWMFSQDGSQAVGIDAGIPITVSVPARTFSKGSANALSTSVSANGSRTALPDTKESCDTCGKDEADTAGSFVSDGVVTITHSGSLVAASEFLGNELVTATIEASVTVTAKNHYRRQGILVGSYVVPDVPEYSAEPHPSISLSPMSSPYIKIGETGVGSQWICNPVYTTNSGAIIVNPKSHMFEAVPGMCLPEKLTVTATGDYGAKASLTVPVLRIGVVVSAPGLIVIGSQVVVSGGIGPYTLSSSGNVTVTFNATSSDSGVFTVTGISCTASGSTPTTSLVGTDHCGVNGQTSALVDIGDNWTADSTTLYSNTGQCYWADMWTGSCLCVNGIYVVGGVINGIPYRTYFKQQGVTTLTEMLYRLSQQKFGGCPNQYPAACNSYAADVMTYNVVQTIRHYICP